MLDPFLQQAMFLQQPKEAKMSTELIEKWRTGTTEKGSKLMAEEKMEENIWPARSKKCVIIEQTDTSLNVLLIYLLFIVFYEIFDIKF